MPRFHYCLKPLYLRDSDTLDAEVGGGRGEGKAIRLCKYGVNTCCFITGEEGHTLVTDKVKNKVAYPWQWRKSWSQENLRIYLKWKKAYFRSLRFWQGKARWREEHCQKTSAVMKLWFNFSSNGRPGKIVIYKVVKKNDPRFSEETDMPKVLLLILSTKYIRRTGRNSVNKHMVDDIASGKHTS